MESALALRRRGPPPARVALGAVALLIALAASYSLSPSPTSPASRVGVDSNYGKLPLAFEPNAGRADPRIDFLAHSVAGGSLYLSGGEATLALEDAALRLGFAGAAVDPDARGLERLPGEANSFIGDDPAQWRSHIPTYGGVRYSEVYPGIDVDFYGSQRNLEYDFRLAPYADPKKIAIDIRGADSARLSANGDLLIAVGERTITQHAPLAYQRVGGSRQRVESAYVLEGSTATIELGSYDRSHPLVIDPTVVYDTHIGGGGADLGFAIAVDSTGAAYITGSTTSTDFPTVGQYQGDQTGRDAFVSKLNPAGTALVYSTYLGGDGAFEDGFGIAVDSAGAAYVGGSTNSTNFPTQDQYQSDQTSFDAFVTKLAPSGAGLEYSTYLGGGSVDDGFAIAVDSAGAAYLTGATSSTDFPLQDQFQTDQPSSDAFITRLDPDPGGAVPVTLGYSSYLGGDSADQGSGVAVDSSGAAYLTGHTSSTNFLTQNPFQGTDPPQQDAFVTKVNADPGGAVAPTLGYSTYLGGAGNFEQGLAIAVDSANSAYVTGRTESADFPTQGPFQGDQPGHDIFVTKLVPAGNAPAYSTYLGGSANDWGFGIAVDSTGAAVITGVTGSSNFPLLDQRGDAAGDDFLLTKLTPSGGGLEYSDYLGGNGTDFGRGIALDSAGNAYVTGFTNSTDVFGSGHPAGDNVAVAKVSPEAATAAPCLITSAEKRAVDKRSGQHLFHIEAHRRDQIKFVASVKTDRPCLVIITESAFSALDFEFTSATIEEVPSGPSGATDVIFTAKPRKAGLLTNTVLVRTEDGDEAEASATVSVSDPQSTIGVSNTYGLAGAYLPGPISVTSGVVPAPEKVDVAVLEAEKGLGLFEGEDPLFNAKRCDWLTKSGKFKEVKPNDDGVCDEPVWIKAKLKGKAKDKKRDWEYEFKKELDPGKYIAYSRATNKAGVSEPVFTKKIGNLKKFKVKP